MARRALVFGGLGAIGEAVSVELVRDGTEVVRTTRRLTPDSDAADGVIEVDPFATPEPRLSALDDLDPVNAVVWAQGANVNDSILDLDLDTHLELLKANCLFVTATLTHLLRSERIASGGRLCVVSSIWQQMARQEKLSYTVSKAALAGLVHSVAVDLADHDVLINAVLPSVTDTPMTRTTLSADQVKRFEGQTGFGRLTTLEDITSLVSYLCSDTNTGVTGQSIAVDLGYTVGRVV